MENQAAFRLIVFVGLFLVLASAETLLPRRERVLSRKQRWLTNWSLTAINTGVLRILGLGLAQPLLAIGAALDAAHNGWGLLNMVNWPSWIEVLLALLVFDFAIWAQHLISHKIPFLWRLHRVHHADTELDVTTAIRFHPVEIALSMMLKIGLVYVIGPSAIAMFLFEIILNGTAMFNHANLNLPPWLDRVLRQFLVTPDMHRVHHSQLRHEHDSNYGFSLSIWDRLFRTYIAQPSKGHEEMTIGLHWQDERPRKLGWSLWLPFQKH